MTIIAFILAIILPIFLLRFISLRSVGCPNCYTVFKGKTCPKCGFKNNHMYGDWYEYKEIHINRMDFTVRIFCVWGIYLLAYFFEQVLLYLISMDDVNYFMIFIFLLIFLTMLYWTFWVTYVAVIQRARDIWGEQPFIYNLFFILLLLNIIAIGVLGYIYLMFKKGNSEVNKKDIEPKD